MADLFATESKAQDLAREGMAAAMAHADRVNLHWSARASELLRAFAQMHPEFMAEDARLWAEEQGLPPAPSARAWGAIAVRARRENLIVAAGYRRTQNRTAHGTPATLWQSLIYRKAA